MIFTSCDVLFKKLKMVNFLFLGRPIPQRSPLVQLLINEECNIPWLFLVDLVTAAANEDLLEQVKRTFNKILS